VVDIQRQLGSDIMMMLDVCSPAKNITKQKVAKQMALTHYRAKTQFDYHMK
jgi:tRNA-guanine family transglycosylase